MSGTDLLDESHVVRYIRPLQFDKDAGVVDGSAFRLRKGETGLSVHWLECFQEPSKLRQVDEVRRLSRLKISKNGRFAELGVGGTKRHVRVRFVHKPLHATNNYEADPSHSEILGLPDLNSPQSALVGDIIAECIKTIHPGLKDN